MAEHVILVDEHDKELGLMEKLEAHRKGLLHRAFSVFILNAKGEMMIHRRALEKYHSGGLWTNACCSHPRQGESILEAGNRRLMEEMGFTTPLTKVLEFTYKAELDSGLTEHEYDHVMIGHFEGEPNPNPDEVCDWKWIEVPALRADIEAHPGNYTEWFKIIFDRFLQEANV
ncbi:MAG: isopentenyl-diphosphate Delta-isomerase [Bacteroidetes bacterium]|uniref:Isopentenyl-diphosphate delta-isomerase n=1 Tax=Phaeocystidibacter marisrubri TaxID=1577780 RepID=A0A6L3ZKQ5_9FLAO|nr:isopentenyl-diphosphate Delta-isomerase [Phaeocystidibacter marisrubri]KAB2817750.1 isopentenyl-diphosphate Delta-isomerase [Phaeocystidibacter marisrubri]TNE30609.1 MAG: isopentenyl-diphosphate Delta-isomerase [Bacteroidota bacterium]GGH73759.1 isopentenyl-diphosphate Delta-isomerase [Phaeocystidibacter marisrubri]